MKVWDISRALCHDLAPWPGDTPFRYRLNHTIAKGSSVNLGSIGLSVHNGTHADAPFHFEENGLTIEQMKLEHYLGRAVVLDLAKHFVGGSRFLIERDFLEPDAATIADTRRLLIKTDVWSDSHVFPERIPVLASGVAEWLGEKGVCLIGFDLPSVDPIEARKLVNHHALNEAGIVIVESLDLRHVAAGVYNFAALPLKIAGADGAPVRAIVWRD